MVCTGSRILIKPFFRQVLVTVFSWKRLQLAYGVVYKPMRDERIENHASVSNRRWFLEGKPFLRYRRRVLLLKATPKAFWMREA
jgi:hypothetical protein